MAPTATSPPCFPSVKKGKEPFHKRLFSSGDVMLEIFHVRLNQQDSESEMTIYGDITVDLCGELIETIWTRPQGNPLCIHPGENIPLHGPSTRVIAEDPLSIKLDIYAVNSGSSAPTRIAKGDISFNPNHPRFIFGERARKIGNVTISYMIIKRALYTEITFTLLNARSNGYDSDETDKYDEANLPANVHGTITAHNGHGESELFRRTRSQLVGVLPNSSLPLARAVVTVPVDGTLRLEAELLQAFDSLQASEPPSPDEEKVLAKGTIEFKPQ